MEDGLGGRSWPLPMSHQDVALRQRCARLLQAVQRIEAWQSNQAKETLDLETPFSMLTKGCVEATEEGLLEAPIYSNSQIEAAWLFLFEVRKRYFNRRKQIQDCTRLLGSSPNWSMVLLGSKKIHESLRNMPPEARSEILEDAGAMDLMTLLSRAPSSYGGFTPNGGLTAPEVRGEWPERPERSEARSGKKNPFVDVQAVAPDPSSANPAQPAPAQVPSSGWPPQDPSMPANPGAGWPTPSVPSMPSTRTASMPNMPNMPNLPNMPNMPNMPSAPSNPFRKESDRGEVSQVRSEASAEVQGQVTAQDVMAGAKFAQDSGLSAKDMMSGARYAQQSGVTPQHALEGARMAHQAGVRPQHVLQGAQMAHQAGLRPQHFVQGAKAAQQAGVTPQHVLAAGKAFAAPQR